MPEFSNTVISVLHKRAAKEQGGLLNGKDPTEFNPDDPIRLWIIQVGIIVSTASLLSLGLRKLRQPKVIAEVLGGIILGPTALGRIPGFTEHVFPETSRSYLSLVANIGLCLFLFLVGLEIESGVVKRNARLSAAIGLAGMVLPFGLGAALSVPIYKEFIDQSVEFTHFMLFTGVAFSITAFPVLCRILTELKLLDTTVGVVVLSAGVANDIVGWSLLALSVALVNAGSGLTALWILLVSIGWALFLLLVVKRALRWLAITTGSVENGPTKFFMTITILLVFGSAFFTDIIGVHAIFGAFLVGIIVPREGNMAIHLTEKLEDMVSIIFLPLYFTISGLSTNLGLLNNGITWGYTIAICALAFIGKFGGCAIAARYAAGFSWRESSAIGSLMSCKGLVELIVLNVGLSAGILSQRVFSMFVLEALLLTFATTPLVTCFYPPESRARVAATGANFKNVSDGKEGRSRQLKPSFDGMTRKRFTFILDKLEHVPGMMVMAQLIQPSVIDDESDTSTMAPRVKAVLGPSIEALRLIELCDRVSAVMKSSAHDSILQSDPVLGIFKMFGQLNNLIITPALAVVPYEDLSLSNNGSEMIMLPWLPPAAEGHTASEAPKKNPFDALFKNTPAPADKSASALHAHFIRDVFARAPTDVALFVDHVAPHLAMGSLQHIFVPFFGGPDDRLALEFVAQLCENPRITATIVKFAKQDIRDDLSPVSPAYLGEGQSAVPATANISTIASSGNALTDTIYAEPTTEICLQSEIADNIAWDRYSSPSPITTYPSAQAQARMRFRQVASPLPLHAMLTSVNGLEQAEGRRTLVVCGRSKRLAIGNHREEMKSLVKEREHVAGDMRKTAGDVASAFVIADMGLGVVVVQAAERQDP